MENEIMVSICCLAYNHSKYIRQCLDGFVNQKTNFKFEVLIHDDASTDGTQDIIKEYEENFPDIIKPIYQTENQYSKGIKVNRTYQYPRVKGKYIAYCEGDDYWTDEYKLQKQFDVLENNSDCSMVVHDVADVSEEGLSLNTFHPQLELDDGIIKPETFLSILSSKEGLPFQLSSYFFRSELLLKNYNNASFMLASSVGDLPLMLLLINYGSIYYIGKVMSCYRNFSQGSWTNRVHLNIDSRIKCNKSTINCFKLYNEYTNKKFDKYITKKIINEEFYVNLLEHNYRTCLNLKYRNQFSSLNIREKLNIIVSALFPRLMNWYRTRGNKNER